MEAKINQRYAWNNSNGVRLGQKINWRYAWNKSHGVPNMCTGLELKSTTDAKDLNKLLKPRNIHHKRCSRVLKDSIY